MTIDLSFKKIVWKPFNFDKRQSLLVSQRYGLNVLLSKLLVIRNIQLEEIDFFLNPELNKILPDPFILKDMEKSVKRIFLSIKNNSVCAKSKLELCFILLFTIIFFDSLFLFVAVRV